MTTLSNANLTLVLTDGGCYSLGFRDRLPSGQAYIFEIAVWYSGQHLAREIH